MQCIKRYFDNTHPVDRPVWSIGLQWFYARGLMDEYPALGWDFCIWQDAQSLARSWTQQGWPFTWASREDRRVFHLQEVLLCRWEVLRGIRQVPRTPQASYAGIHLDPDSIAEATDLAPSADTTAGIDEGHGDIARALTTPEAVTLLRGVLGGVRQEMSLVVLAQQTAWGRARTAALGDLRAFVLSHEDYFTFDSSRGLVVSAVRSCTS